VSIHPADLKRQQANSIVHPMYVLFASICDVCL